jgi:hypothetical protein
MSSLGKLAAASLKPVFSQLGADDQTDQLKINSGEAWDVVRNEERTNRDYEFGGQQIDVDFSAVGSATEFAERYTGTPQSYLGKTATMNGKTYTVAGISTGEAFIEVGLNHEEQAP